VLLNIPGILKPQEVQEARRLLDEAEWNDGKLTAGHQSALAKDNMQLAETHPIARKLGDMILAALEQSSLFMSAALPLKVFPPLFNRYQAGQSFGTHVDNAIRQVTGTPYRVRTDLSATLFISAPDEYEGGELIIEDTYGVQKVKLPEGHMILYPASSLHHVTPVTRGTRTASFFWIQSMVQDDGERTLLFDLDMAIQRVAEKLPEQNVTVQLTSIYHNLLRRYAQV
jgi:PKHD-type hydroxylase